MTTTGHDPEHDAAAFLNGDQPDAVRRAFEQHMVSCDVCWAEVRDARAGRALAESLRETAPQAVRELLRAVGASEATRGHPATEHPRPRPSAGGTRMWPPLSGYRVHRARMAAAAACMLTALAVGTVAVMGNLPGHGPNQDPLRAAVTVFQEGTADPGGEGRERPPVQRIGELDWQGTVRADLAGSPASVHRYADSVGHRLILISSAVHFPRAADAQRVGVGTSWVADVGGAALYCVDHGGLSWLVVAETREQALDAGLAAGLV